MNAMPSKKDQYHARKTLKEASRRPSREEEAQLKAMNRVGEKLAKLQMERGGRFYWSNGVVRHVTLHPTKGFRDNRHGELLAPLINGITVRAEARA